jgi:hypothetical protein
MSIELTPFAEILNNCLEAIERGEATAQECLERYPKYQAQLRPLLTMAGRLSELHTVQPSAAFRSQAAARLQTRLVSSGRPPQPGNGNGSGPASGISGGLSHGLGRLGLLLLGLSLAAGLAIALPRPDNPVVDSPTVEPPTLQVGQPVDEVETVDMTEPPGRDEPASQPRPSPTASVGANYETVQDVPPLEGDDPLITPEQAIPPGLVGEEPAAEDGSGNNGHGNNIDGVDSSNPSQDIGGPSGEDDPSGEVDDESKSINDGSSNNGHGNNTDGVDSSSPSQGIGGPNGEGDPSGEVDDEGGGGNNSNNGNNANNENDHPGKDK